MEYLTKKFLVRYCETDQMGIVHHSNYLKYLELARIEWMEKLNISYSEIESHGIIMPVVNANLNFKSPAYFNDRLQIKITLSKPPSAKIVFSYEIQNQFKKKICSANTTLCFIEKSSMKPIRLPKIFNVFVKN